MIRTSRFMRTTALGALLTLTLGWSAFALALEATVSEANVEQVAIAADVSDLRTSINTLLQEHVYLATSATGAALGGRQAQFEAAAGALDANSVELAGLIGSVYGAEAEAAFLALWRRHIGFFVDYTTGVATANESQQTMAVESLLGYANDFAAFLSSANPYLPKMAVVDLVKAHVVTLKAVVDAQGAGDEVAAYTAVREAAAHMKMIADPLADAITQQFPDKYTMDQIGN